MWPVGRRSNATGVSDDSLVVAAGDPRKSVQPNSRYQRCRRIIWNAFGVRIMWPTAGEFEMAQRMMDFIRAAIASANGTQGHALAGESIPLGLRRVRAIWHRLRRASLRSRGRLAEAESGDDTRCGRSPFGRLFARSDNGDTGQRRSRATRSSPAGVRKPAVFPERRASALAPRLMVPVGRPLSLS